MPFSFLGYFCTVWQVKKGWIFQKHHSCMQYFLRECYLIVSKAEQRVVEGEEICCNQALAWKCSTCGSVSSRQDDDSLLPLLPVLNRFYFIMSTAHKDQGRVRAHNQWMPIVCLMARNHHQITGLNICPLSWAPHALLPLVLIAVSILAASLSGSKFGSGTTVGYVGSPYRDEQCDHSRNRWIICIHYIF